MNQDINKRDFDWGNKYRNAITYAGTSDDALEAYYLEHPEERPKETTEKITTSGDPVFDKWGNRIETGLNLADQGTDVVGGILGLFKDGTTASTGGNDFVVDPGKKTANPNMKFWLIGGGVLVIGLGALLYATSKKK